MKKIGLLFIIFVLGLTSCTREELEVVDVPGKFNNNSRIYQEYLAERAVSFIKIYRFDKIKTIVEQITNPTIREEIDKVYKEYRTKADKEALFFVTEANDTLFFMLPSEEEPDPATRTQLSLDYEMINVPKVKGTLSGLRKFPKLTNIYTPQGLAGAVKELQHLPELERFYWGRDESFFLQHFPNQIYKVEKLIADFSKNKALKTIVLENVDIERIVFPETKIESFELTGALSVFNSNSVLNTLKAQKADLKGIAANSDFTLVNHQLDELIIQSSSIRNLDISQTNLQTVDLSPVEQVIWNKSIQKIKMQGTKLKSPMKFPGSTESLEIGNYTQSDWDFSYLSRLTEFNAWFSGVDYLIEPKDFKLPLSLEKLTLSIHPKEDQRFDFSYLSNLKELQIPTDTYYDLRLPAGLESLHIYGPAGILDLSHLVGLKYIQLFGYEKLKEIRFPTSLPGSMKTDGSFYVSINRATKLINAPAWVNDLIQYND